MISREARRRPSSVSSGNGRQIWWFEWTGGKWSVPNVVGDTQAAAASAITSAGLVLGSGDIQQVERHGRSRGM